MPIQKVLIIEDEKPIRTMLRYALEMVNMVVYEAEDVKRAQALLCDVVPNLILLDWMLPSVSGVEFAGRLKKDKLTRNIPIIMLTAKADEENKILGLEAGADDYIVKPFSPRELIARIRAVLRRGPMNHDDGVLTAKQLIVDTQSQRAVIEGKHLKLGPLEYRLLCFFITHPDRVYTRDELLTHVWGVDAYVDERTVDVHVRRLRKQLSLQNHHHLIQTVHGSGYRFSEKTND